MKLTSHIIFISSLLFCCTSVWAAPNAGHEQAGHEQAGYDQADGQDDHGSDDHHDGKHHAYYSDDDDGDGIPNWRDRYQFDERNTETYHVTNLIFHAFNLSLLLFIIVWFGRKPITDGLKNRAERIRHELTDSARLRDEAQKKYEEVDARLRHIADEIENIKTQGADQAQQEEQRLIERAKSEAQRIEDGAKRHIRDALVRARVELRDEAVSLAIEMAENIVKKEVSGEDQTRLAQAFLASLDSEKGGIDAS